MRAVDNGDVRWHVRLRLVDPYAPYGHASTHASCATREEALARLG